MVCGGLRWFACVVSGYTPIVPNSGGDLWWFAVMCGGFGGLRWFSVICGGLSFSHTDPEGTGPKPSHNAPLPLILCSYK